MMFNGAKSDEIVANESRVETRVQKVSFLILILIRVWAYRAMISRCDES